MDRGIINTWDQNTAAGGRRVILWRRSQGLGRDMTSAAWQVGVLEMGKEFMTDPKAPWYNRGLKTFDIWGRKDVKPKLQEAVAWVNANLNFLKVAGPLEFVPNRCGDYVEKQVQKAFPIPKRDS